MLGNAHFGSEDWEGAATFNFGFGADMVAAEALSESSHARSA